MKSVTVHKQCTKEGCDGELKSTWISMSNSVGTTYMHKCNKCDLNTGLDRSYPATHFEFTPEELETRWE